MGTPILQETSVSPVATRFASQIAAFDVAYTWNRSCSKVNGSRRSAPGIDALAGEKLHGRMANRPLIGSFGLISFAFSGSETRADGRHPGRNCDIVVEQGSGKCSCNFCALGTFAVDPSWVGNQLRGLNDLFGRAFRWH